MKVSAIIKKEFGCLKICITAEGENLDCKVDLRFGRCKNFIFMDTNSESFEVEKNPNAEFSGGAGIQSAQLMSSRGVKAVLTGNMGPNACDTLNAAGIDFYTGISGTVKETVEAFKSGKLKKNSEPSVKSKSGFDYQI